MLSLLHSVYQISIEYYLILLLSQVCKVYLLNECLNYIIVYYRKHSYFTVNKTVMANQMHSVLYINRNRLLCFIFFCIQFELQTAKFRTTSIWSLTVTEKKDLNIWDGAIIIQKCSNVFYLHNVVLQLYVTLRPIQGIAQAVINQIVNLRLLSNNDSL